jgi:hypothetical protein
MWDISNAMDCRGDCRRDRAAIFLKQKQHFEAMTRKRVAELASGLRQNTSEFLDTFRQVFNQSVHVSVVLSGLPDV